MVGLLCLKAFITTFGLLFKLPHPFKSSISPVITLPLVSKILFISTVTKSFASIPLKSGGFASILPSLSLSTSIISESPILLFHN